MKIKVNEDTNTVSIKGLTSIQFGLIEALLSHVRLGDGTAASEAAFEMLNAFEQCEDLDDIDRVSIDIGATTDGNADDIELWLNSPTLVACENDDGNDMEFDAYVSENASRIAKQYTDMTISPAAGWPFGTRGCSGQCDSCDCGE